MTECGIKNLTSKHRCVFKFTVASSAYVLLWKWRISVKLFSVAVVQNKAPWFFTSDWWHPPPPHSRKTWGFSSPNAGVSNRALPLQVMFLAPGNAWPDSCLTAQKRCNLSILDTANKQQRKRARQLYLSLPSTLSHWQVSGEPGEDTHTQYKETYFLGNKPKGALPWEWRLSARSNTHKKELNTFTSAGAACTSFHLGLKWHPVHSYINKKDFHEKCIYFSCTNLQ